MMESGIPLCSTYGEPVGFSSSSSDEVFVACPNCNYPLCRSCLEEIREDRESCLRCGEPYFHAGGPKKLGNHFQLSFLYLITNPVDSAYGLWLNSVICEVWFAFSWVLDQFPKWSPICRETYIDTLSERYEMEGESCMLASVGFFVSTVDPLKEPPLVTANTVLSILAVDYPVEKYRVMFPTMVLPCLHLRPWQKQLSLQQSGFHFVRNT